MKKIVALLLSFCILFCLVACGSNTATSGKPQNDNGQSKNNNSITEETKEDVKNNNSFTEETKKEDVIVTVIEKKNVPKNTNEGRYSDRVEFSFSVENLTMKSIKGVQGTLIVKDLFDEKIISIGCDFTGKTIPANNKITFEDIGIDINQFMDNHIKLYNEKYEDLNFSYEVNNIVYTDSPYNNQQDEMDNTANTSVTVEVTNKYNLGKDYYAGRYSERVEFSFKITNTGSKSINGVQGTLIVKDLFHERIISIDCDFTGNTISPNNYINVSDLGIDINQFMDDHIKLYNEKFEDLNFEYKVKSIVYTDGSVDRFD